MNKCTRQFRAWIALLLGETEQGVSDRLTQQVGQESSLNPALHALEPRATLLVSISLPTVLSDADKVSTGIQPSSKTGCFPGMWTLWVQC